jgi:hypothetical protein
MPGADDIGLRDKPARRTAEDGASDFLRAITEDGGQPRGRCQGLFEGGICFGFTDCPSSDGPDRRDHLSAASPSGAGRRHCGLVERRA